MAKLATYVYVDGKGYGPDDDVPADVARQIGDHCWADGKRPRSSEPAKRDDGPPAMNGKGSGIEEWRAYADRLEVPLDPDAKRDDIVDAIRDAGHPVD